MKVKKCAKCNEVKPIDDFEENQYSPDGRYLICRDCFDKRLNIPVQIPDPQVNNQKPEKLNSQFSGEPGEVSLSKSQPPVQVVQPEKTIIKSRNDEKQDERIKQAQQEILSDGKSVSFQARGLLPKLRKCSGCKKVEPVGSKVPAKPPKPVQAWFCDDCFKSKTHTYAGKGYLVYDFWGRIYKVTKILDNQRVRGVVKKGDGRWSKRKFSIYGRWLTIKPL